MSITVKVLHCKITQKLYLDQESGLFAKEAKHVGNKLNKLHKCQVQKIIFVAYSIPRSIVQKLLLFTYELF